MGRDSAGEAFADPPALQPWDRVHLRGPDGQLCDFHTAPLPAFVMEPRSLRLLEVNEAFVRRLGYPAAEVTGRALGELQPPDDRHEVLALCRRVPAGRDVGCVIRLCAAGGHTLGLRLDCRQTLYEDRAAVLGLLREDRLLGEQERRLSSLQRHAEALFRHMPCAALALDEVLVVRDLNEEARRTLVAADDGDGALVGRSLLDLLSPEAARRVEAALLGLTPGRAVRLSLSFAPGGGTAGGELDAELVCGDDHRGQRSHCLMLRPAPGELTVSRRASDHVPGYSEIIASSLDAILVTDRGGVVQEANSEASRLLGYSVGELRGMHREQIYDAEDPRLAGAMVQRAGNGVFHGRLSLCRVDGTVFEAEVRSTLFRGPGGSLLAGTIIRDLSERRREEEERNLLNRLLRKVVRRADTDSVIASLSEYLSHQVDYASFCLYRHDRTDGFFRSYCWRGLDPALVRALDAVPAGAEWSPVAAVADSGRPLLIESLRRSREWPRLHHTARLFRLDRLQVLPVMQPNRRVDGVLVLYLNDYEHGLDPDSPPVESLSNVISLVFRACDRQASDDARDGGRLSRSGR